MSGSASMLNSPISRPESVGSVNSAASDSTSSSLTGRGSKRNQDIYVSEELKIAIDCAIERFKSASPDDYHVLEFPSSLTSTERAYIHRIAAARNLKSESKGKKHNRILTVTRLLTKSVGYASTLSIGTNTCHHISYLLQKCPVSSKEASDLTPAADRIPSNAGDVMKITTGRLNNGLPQVPPQTGDPKEEISNLAIFQCKHEIINAISVNPVVMICGESGCGKTTQVPQIILDACSRAKAPCRIICAQPRKLAAISTAEGVVGERGEQIGHTVGYQIQLESRVSPKTLLTYCTYGVLIRTLTSSRDNFLSSVTHIVVDEVHERDEMCDFLLIILKQALSKHKNLKIILMSATPKADLFQSFFSFCPVISVPGSANHVQEFFLEDILKMTGYTTKKMLGCKRKLEQVAQAEGRISSTVDAVETEHGIMHNMDDEHPTDISKDLQNVSLEGTSPDPVVTKQVDKLLEDILNNNEEDLFNQIYSLVLSDVVSADYEHSILGMTPLMVAVSKGMITPTEQLINLGATVNYKSLKTHFTALGVARKMNQPLCVELLQSYLSPDETDSVDDELTGELSTHDRILLEAYHNSTCDEKVDTSLMKCLMKMIMQNTDSSEAILVFLPGFQDLVLLNDFLSTETIDFSSSRVQIFLLHSYTQTSELKKAFKRPPQGIRKIVLSTNVAETSITISDVVHVIDCGKVMEKSFDAFSGISSFRCNWISKANVMQRTGRAGSCKPGFVYHLYSSPRYKLFLPCPVAEIMRSSLQQLCLYGKLIAPVDMNISDFLAQAPEPPAPLLVKNAITLLKQMDGLDNFEDLTECGHHLLDLPVEPRLGKMILFSVILKCLDPVLTITCTLAYNEPFIHPNSPKLKRAAAKAHMKFSADSLSDHMVYLRVFQAWQKARAEGSERLFCEKNFVSSATMDMILGLRSLVLGQLRASGFVRAHGNGDIRDLNCNSDNWAVVKAALCAGSHTNLLKIDKSTGQLITSKDWKIRFHQTSVLNPSLGKSHITDYKDHMASFPTDWVFYEELCRSQGTFSTGNFPCANARCATVVSPVTVFLFAGPSKLALSLNKEFSSPQGEGYLDVDNDSSDSDTEDSFSHFKSTFAVDNWVKFKMEAHTAELLKGLRQKVHSLILRRLSHPNKPMTQADDLVLKCLVQVLSSEEHALGLKQPAGVGQRPRPVVTGTLGSSGYGEPNDALSDDPTTREGDNFRESRAKPIHLDKSQGRAGYSDSSAASSRQSSATSSPRNSPGPGNFTLLKGINSSRYFAVKSSSQKTLNHFHSKGIWAAGEGTSKCLTEALQECQNVYIICSVVGESHFSGVAVVSRPAPKEVISDLNEPGLATAFFVTWIHRAPVSFYQAQTLCNSWDNGRPVYSSKDGQEIEQSVGELLIKMWGSLPSE